MYTFAVKYDNTPILIDETSLSAFILTNDDIEMIDSLQSDSRTLVNSLSSELLAKTGPGSVTKQELDGIYVRVKNSQGLKKTDLENFYKYIYRNLIGYQIVDSAELELPINIDGLWDVEETNFDEFEDDRDLTEKLKEFN